MKYVCNIISLQKRTTTKVGLDDKATCDVMTSKLAEGRNLVGQVTDDAMYDIDLNLLEASTVRYELLVPSVGPSVTETCVM